MGDFLNMFTVFLTFIAVCGLAVGAEESSDSLHEVRRQLDLLRADYEGQLNLLRTESRAHSHELNLLRAQYGRQLNQLKAEHSDQLDQLRTEYQHLTESGASTTTTTRSAICAFNDGISGGTNGTVTFTEVYQPTTGKQEGSNLNATTGTFTAGVEGVYQISASGQCEVDPENSMQINLLYKCTGEGASQKLKFIQSSNDLGFSTVSEQCSATWFLSLAPGDQVFLEFYAQNMP